ncbi:cyclase family protein [Vermiphilus pyriformis]|nr:MAG: cyclase family protein [Vermiphilus pyriformis]
MILDISWPLTSGMTGYKNKKTFESTPIKLWDQDHVREAQFTCTTHTGTHVDMPAHFLQDGYTAEQAPLDRLIGTCRVIDMTHVTECISAEDLYQYDIKEGQRILFKTSNSNRSYDQEFDYNFVYVAHTAASYLVEKKVVCVGIDYLGIERNQPGHPTHKTLLDAGIIIIEGLRLHNVLSGTYTLLCLPLLLQGLDGAPARAVLMPYQRVV